MITMYKASLVLLVTLSGLSGCGKELPPVPEPESRPAKLFTVSVGNNAFERNFPATTEAGDKAVLAFRVPGLLQTLDVTSGQQVSKGEKLAMLNPDEYQLLEKQAKANFKLTDVQYQRAIKLRKDRVVSEQDFDQAKANIICLQEFYPTEYFDKYFQKVYPYLSSYYYEFLPYTYYYLKNYYRRL